MPFIAETNLSWETIMRFTPAAILLAGALALSSSSGIGRIGPQGPSSIQNTAPEAAVWSDHGSEALDAGDLTRARSAYETALLLAPGDPSIYFALGKVARAEKMPGRAIKYFDDAIRLDPKNQTAVLEEGLAMMDKGAIESARQTLAQLKTLCAKNCAIAEPLAAAIAAGPPKVVTAEAGKAPPQAPLAK
jgi:tetratricopeptide (TPR) repeat protein